MRRLATILLALSLAAALASPAVAAQKRIINGTTAADGEYPWAVGLIEAGQSPLTQFCGGTLVSATMVLTASHCIDQPDVRLRPNQLEVYAGFDRNLRTASRANGGFHQVAGITFHPDVDEDTGRYDLALLRLATPVAGDPSLDLIGVGVDPADGTPLRIVGWGLMQTGAPADELMQADVDMWDHTDCEVAWNAEDGTTIFDDMLCALDPGPPLHDTCNGDSGGPIMLPGASKTDPTGWTLVGATSFGSQDCDRDDLPGVYVRLAQASVHDLVTRATDGDPTNDPPETASWASGRPSLSSTAPKIGDTLTCTTGDVVFVPATSTVTLGLRRTAGADLVTGTGPLSYTVTSADVGARFVCDARAYNGFASGPFGDVRSSNATEAVPAPPQPAEPTPAPEPTPTPPPPVVEPPAVPFRDLAAPTVDAFSRSCTRRRRCTLRLRVNDPFPSSGVRTPVVKITSTVRRRCVRDGRRRTCTKRTTRTLRARRSGTTTTFLVSTGVLAKGRHKVTVTAADIAGNRRRLPFTSSFSVSGAAR